MLEDVKNALRISDDDFDNEIRDLIEAAKSDLETSGVASSFIREDKNGPLIKNAIINFCKAEFGYDNPDSDRFRRAYESLKIKLALRSKEE